MVCNRTLGNFVCGNIHPLLHREGVFTISDHHTSSTSREGLLGVLYWSQASCVPRGSGDASEVVESAGVPSYQTMDTLRMQVGPGLCGLEQLLKPQGEQQAEGAADRKREEAASVLAERGGPSAKGVGRNTPHLQDSRAKGCLNDDSDKRGGICERTSCWRLGLGSLTRS